MNQRYLQECLLYHPETGLLFWRKRPREHFKSDRLQHSWNRQWALRQAGNKNKRHGYINITLDGRCYWAHRLIWMYIHGSFPEGEIDHINHDKSDNRISNLRDIPESEQNKNISRAINNTSGFTGVTWHSASNKWQAQIRVNRKAVYLGTYDSKLDAIAARMRANRLYGFHVNHGSGLS